MKPLLTQWIDIYKAIPVYTFSSEIGISFPLWLKLARR